MPSDLLEAVDTEAERLGTKRSQLVRLMIREWLERRQREAFEALLAEGYRVMADQAAAFAQESQYAVGEATEATWRWDD
jgi:metal-responsive CopG/Arc/MetJ family transcriptional regulator